MSANLPQPQIQPLPLPVPRRYLFDTHGPIRQKRWLAEGFIKESNLVIWMGKEKHRKSNLILQMVICISAGRPFLKFPVPQPVRVVYVDYESSAEEIKERYDAICRELKLTASEERLLKANLQIVKVTEIHEDGGPFPRISAKQDESADFWQAFVQQFPADIYILDPMRSAHMQDENDSKAVDLFLAQLRKIFGKAAIILPHHMRKFDTKQGGPALTSDIQGWSDNVRGSSAIKAHANVIVCQEKKKLDSVETLDFGAFGKGFRDIEPIALEETEIAPPSFFWVVSKQVPEKLRESFEALRKNGGPFTSMRVAAKVIANATGKSEGTGKNHVRDMVNQGLLVEVNGRWEIEFSLKPSANPNAQPEDPAAVPQPGDSTASNESATATLELPSSVQAPSPAEAQIQTGPGRYGTFDPFPADFEERWELKTRARA